MANPIIEANDFIKDNKSVNKEKVVNVSSAFSSWAGIDQKDVADLG